MFDYLVEQAGTRRIEEQVDQQRLGLRHMQSSTAVIIVRARRFERLTTVGGPAPVRYCKVVARGQDDNPISTCWDVSKIPRAQLTGHVGIKCGRDSKEKSMVRKAREHNTGTESLAQYTPAVSVE